MVASNAHSQVDYSKGNNSKFAYAISLEMIINYVLRRPDVHRQTGPFDVRLYCSRLPACLPSGTDDSIHIAGHSLYRINVTCAFRLS